MDKDRRIEELEKLVEEQDIEIKVLKKLNSMLKVQANANETRIHDMLEMLRKNFRSATEQMMLFDDIENTAMLGSLEETQEDSEVNVQAYTRKKIRSGINLPADTPVVDIRDDSPVPSCERCGSLMKEAGEKIYESFTRIERTVIVRRHVKQYVCPSCEPDEGEGRKTVTPVTGNMLDGTVCDPTLLSQIVENKFSFAQPLYRQEKIFSDVGLSRFTMSSWLMRIGERLEANMAPCLEKLIYSHPLVNVDETPVQVLGLLDKDGKRKAPNSSANAWMVVRAAMDAAGRNGPVMFTFTDNRRTGTLVSLLTSYTGVVQTDGLYGYSNAEKECSFTHIGCLVHARRKAVEANGDRKSGVAFELLKLYASFFHEEGLLLDGFRDGTLPEDVFLRRRREVLGPILEKIHAFCLANVDKAIGKLRTALQYPLNRWDTLVGFLEHPFATSSNQRAENAIRPFTVGRKNWLFNITESGATVSAFFYSLVESCKVLGIRFQDYMTHVLLNANTIKDGDEEAWTAILPGRCDISDAVAYREQLFSAAPDTERTEPYRLRGKRV